MNFRFGVKCIIQYLVQSVDYSSNFLYVICDCDLLVSFYSHQINSYFLRVSSKILNIAEVAVSDFLPSLTLFLLHHVQKPSTTRLGQGWSVKMSGSVNLLRLVLQKPALFALFISGLLLLNKDNGTGVSLYSKLVSTVISL